MFGPFGDIRVGAAVGSTFGRAAERVRTQLHGSIIGALPTQVPDPPGKSELLQRLREAVTAEAGDGRTAGGPACRIAFEPSAGNHEEFAADIGVRLEFLTEDFESATGLLACCHGMGGSEHEPTFETLCRDGEAQAKRMLDITPSSVFLLFHRIHAGTVGQWIGPPACFYPIEDRVVQTPPGWTDFWRYTGKATPALSLWNSGITVLPAIRLLAEARARRRTGQRLPVDARHWASATIPLGVFISDMLGACVTGDARPEVLRAVTPSPRVADRGSSATRILLALFVPFLQIGLVATLTL